MKTIDTASDILRGVASTPPSGVDQSGVIAAGLAKRYGKTTALDGVSFDVAPGQGQLFLLGDQFLLEDGHALS